MTLTSLHVTVYNCLPFCRQVPVVTAYWGSKYMGLLKLSWSKATGLKVQSSGPVLLGGSNSSRKINPDPAVAKVIAPYKPAVDAVSFQVSAAHGKHATAFAGRHSMCHCVQLTDLISHLWGTTLLGMALVQQ